ncbi:hypothetical protein HDV00_007193 [Rhizophlyctis rosea]|nr:hypothetical protein HDV00_007193 [Rhizophlyctis rosea]
MPRLMAEMVYQGFDERYWVRMFDDRCLGTTLECVHLSFEDKSGLSKGWMEGLSRFRGVRENLKPLSLQHLYWKEDLYDECGGLEGRSAVRNFLEFVVTCQALEWLVVVFVWDEWTEEGMRYEEDEEELSASVLIREVYMRFGKQKTCADFIRYFPEARDGSWVRREKFWACDCRAVRKFVARAGGLVQAFEELMEELGHWGHGSVVPR